MTTLPDPAVPSAAHPAPKNKRMVMIYSRYERFWHWSQALLIFVLVFSGFAVHGTHSLIGFNAAVSVHTIAALALIVLWVFTTFWHFTTGQWRQYLPKSGLFQVVKFYAVGILTGAPHPYSKSLHRKQNALQSLAYLTFMVMIGPALWLSGILYLTYPLWNKAAGQTFGLGPVAFIHTAASFMMVTFVLIHIYMTTTGKSVGHYVKTMITGYDTVEMDEAEEAYLKSQGTRIFR